MGRRQASLGTPVPRTPTPPEAHLLLYHSEDGERVATTMHVFDEQGLVPLKPSLPLGSPVPVSSGEPEEEEKTDSEVTLEEVEETSPRSRTSSFGPSLMTPTPTSTQSGSRL